MTAMPEGDIRVVFDRDSVLEEFGAVVVVLFSPAGLLMVWNEERAWEFPGGLREPGETFAMTAEREVLEETGMLATGIEYLGYYVAPRNHITVITCAEIPPGELRPDVLEKAGIGLFEELPDQLSFGDGREQLFLKHARAFRSTRARKP